MSSLYKAFGTNKTYEESGVTLDLGGSKFRICRAGGGNRRYNTVFNAKMRPHRTAYAAGVLPEEISRDVLMETYFDTVVLGWEGVEDENGSPMEYNLKNFKKLMTDLPDLWMLIIRESDNIKNFQVEETKADGQKLGNS